MNHISTKSTRAFFARAFAGAGVLLGIYALTMGWGQRAVVNDVAHRVMLPALVAGLLMLSTGSAQHELHFAMSDRSGLEEGQ
jgi:hypothetical protein